MKSYPVAPIPFENICKKLCRRTEISQTGKDIHLKPFENYKRVTSGKDVSKCYYWSPKGGMGNLTTFNFIAYDLIQECISNVWESVNESDKNTVDSELVTMLGKYQFEDEIGHVYALENAVFLNTENVKCITLMGNGSEVFKIENPTRLNELRFPVRYFGVYGMMFCQTIFEFELHDLHNECSELPTPSDGTSPQLRLGASAIYTLLAENHISAVKFPLFYELPGSCRIRDDQCYVIMKGGVYCAIRENDLPKCGDFISIPTPSVTHMMVGDKEYICNFCPVSPTVDPEKKRISIYSHELTDVVSKIPEEYITWSSDLVILTSPPAKDMIVLSEHLDEIIEIVENEGGKVGKIESVTYYTDEQTIRLEEWKSSTQKKQIELYEFLSRA